MPCGSFVTSCQARDLSGRTQHPQSHPRMDATVILQGFLFHLASPGDVEDRSVQFFLPFIFYTFSVKDIYITCIWSLLVIYLSMPTDPDKYFFIMLLEVKAHHQVPEWKQFKSSLLLWVSVIFLVPCHFTKGWPHHWLRGLPWRWRGLSQLRFN